MLMLAAQINKRFPHLRFRRQFLFGPEAYAPNVAWNVHRFDDWLFLSAHRDVESLILSSAGRTIGLVGYLIDSAIPAASSEEILKRMLDESSSADDLFRRADALSGRWVLLYKDATECAVFTDPCGFRQVYYAEAGGTFWCGSQPEIIRQVAGLKKTADSRLKSFLASEGYRRQESAWVGAGTIYDRCSHLLPNHFLCLRRREAMRFYPRSPLPAMDTANAVEEASRILRGSIEGMALRAPLMLPVTAGYDSRVLLAASRNVKERVVYYVDRMGMHGEEHPDVAVPTALARILGLRFTVLDSAETVPRWFARLNCMNVTRARNLPKTRMIYAHYKSGTAAVNVNGNASEICRNFFDKKRTLDQRGLSAADLSRLLFHQETDFAVTELDIWLKDARGALESGYEPLDMLYWEQRLGNWGAHFPAEQDIAIEEFSPFNNRRLISLLLTCPAHLRVAPDYELYRQMIGKLWPEALCVPFNPPHEPKASSSARFAGALRFGRG